MDTLDVEELIRAVEHSQYYLSLKLSDREFCIEPLFFGKALLACYDLKGDLIGDCGKLTIPQGRILETMEITAITVGVDITDWKKIELK